MAKRIPDVLHKYRAFDARTIENLCADRVYYADPSTFNDPLDCLPHVEADCDVPTLEQTVFELIRRRVSDEMRVGAKTVKYRGAETSAHIEKHSRAAAEQALAEVRYNATDPELSGAAPNALAYLLAYTIENELLRQYSKGILSLATRFDCPLMWSHYGDQHRGLCIGYSVPQEARPNLHEVLYGGSREVRASDVASMLSGDEKARSAVDGAVLLKKAQDWQYENEWRMLGTRGVADSALEMVEITFGMRCPSPVMHAVTCALDGREKPIAFFTMRDGRTNFELQRDPLDTDELSVSYPRRALSAFEGFEILDSKKSNAPT